MMFVKGGKKGMRMLLVFASGWIWQIRYPSSRQRFAIYRPRIKRRRAVIWDPLHDVVLQRLNSKFERGNRGKIGENVAKIF